MQVQLDRMPRSRPHINHPRAGPAAALRASASACARGRCARPAHRSCARGTHDLIASHLPRAPAPGQEGIGEESATPTSCLPAAAVAGLYNTPKPVGAIEKRLKTLHVAIYKPAQPVIRSFLLRSNRIFSYSLTSLHWVLRWS